MSEKRSDLSDIQNDERAILDERDIPPQMLRVLKIVMAEERKKLSRAFRAVGFFALTGFAIGMLLVLVEDNFHLKTLPNWHRYLGFVMEHAGIGLIVSAIAVFGYEWRSHTKEAFEAAQNLNKSIDEVAHIRATLMREKDIEDLLKRTNDEIAKMRSAEGWQALEVGLEELLGGDSKKKNLRENIKQIVRSAHTLKQKQTDETAQYLNVLSWLVGESARENAKVLEGLANEELSDWYYRVPSSAAQMAARILGAQMKVMKKGDSYDSVSDLMLWRDKQLQYFFDNVKKAALEREVKFRRVFNLCNMDLKRYHKERRQDLDALQIQNELEEIISIINPHLDLQERCELHAQKDINWTGSYEVKFLTEAHVPKLKALTKRREIEIKGASFALFKKHNSERIIRFQAEDTTPLLSRMRLGYRTTKDPDVYFFKDIWEIASSENPFPPE